MQRWALHLATLGTVRALDYPYMQQGRRRPDPLPTLISAHKEALDAAAAVHPGPLVLAGKSMGGRVGCHVALDSNVAAVIAFGYPLLSSGKLHRVRDEVLKELRLPILFVQGSRDPLCPLELLDSVRGKMTAPNELYVVGSGDHSLKVSKAWLRENHSTEPEVEGGILAAVAGFLASYCPGF